MNQESPGRGEMSIRVEYDARARGLTGCGLRGRAGPMPDGNKFVAPGLAERGERGWIDGDPQGELVV